MSDSQAAVGCHHSISSVENNPLSTQSAHSESPGIWLDNNFMYTEEQITKQLADMREQADFMKNFRNVLGIALREIKSLRAATSSANVRNNETMRARRLSACGSADSIPTTSLQSLDFEPLTSPAQGNGSADKECISLKSASCVDLVEKLLNARDSDSKDCLCSEFRSMDLDSVRNFLEKSRIGGVKSEVDAWRSGQFANALRKNVCSDHIANKSSSKVDREGLKLVGADLDGCIRRIDNLRSKVADRDETVAQLHKKLSEAITMRVKRESKLDQKLNEVKEWRTKYGNVKALNEKQAKVSRGLRVALKIERHRVQSSEKLIRGLEETRRAFQMLKGQAGQMMETLKEKDAEINDLNAKLGESQRNGENYLHVHDVPEMSLQIHGSAGGNWYDGNSKDIGIQTEETLCDECTGMRIEISAAKDRYEVLLKDFGEYKTKTTSDDFAQHFYNAPSYANSDAHRNSKFSQGATDAAEQRSDFHTETGSPAHGQHHGRKGSKMYAPYISPDRYRRVSRPPLRQRHHDTHHWHTRVPPQHISHHISHDQRTLTTCPLSPIYESNTSNGNRQEVSVEGEPGSLRLNPLISSPRQSPIHTKTFGTNRPLLHHGAHQMSFKPNLTHETSPHVNSSLVNTKPNHEQKTIIAELDGSSDVAHKRKPARPNDFGTFNMQGPTQRKGSPSPIGQLHGQHSTISPVDENTMSTKSPIEQVTSDVTKESTILSHGKEVKKEKTSYLEVGDSGSSSPSNSSAGSILTPSQENQPPLYHNLFIRSPEEFESDRDSLFSDDVCSDSTSQNEYPITDSQVMPQFGVMWHPAMVTSHSESCDAPVAPSPAKSHTSHGTKEPDLIQPVDSLQVFQKNVANKLVPVPGQRHKRNASNTGHYVTYKEHKIDVTNFSIHAFRDIVWTLEGPNAADDFIKFLSSLAKKLNSNQKWAGKHALGNPKDWLELRGLF